MNALSWLLHLVAPSEKLPADTSPLTLVWEGMPLFWAVILFAALASLAIASYAFSSRSISAFARVGLICLRLAFLGLVILILAHPVLVIPVQRVVRRPLLVLLDLSRSMTLRDQRSQLADRVRAAIAKGSVAPTTTLDQSIPPLSSPDLNRREILEAISSNPLLDLWPRLAARADLSFYGVGQTLSDLGTPSPGAVAPFLRKLTFDASRTALGDGLRDLLQRRAGEEMGGIFLITDGNNNLGSSPVEAAAVAREQNVPLFIYGVGVTEPPDISVTEIVAVPECNVRERLDLAVHLVSHGFVGRQARLQLKAVARVVAEQRIDFRNDGPQEIQFSLTPEQLGALKLEASIAPLTEETRLENNAVRKQIWVTDEKTEVLFVEGEPRWDFQFLLAMLQRDRRLRAHCVLLHGDFGLAQETGSPFLAEFPRDRTALAAYRVIVFGDVNPSDLGQERLEWLADWVRETGGGLVFLAGQRFNPAAYPGTPLDSLLPITPLKVTANTVSADLVSLRLTPAGQASPLLVLSKNPAENAALWDRLGRARWTAPATAIRPEAQVLLTDLSPAKATPQGALPVIAWQKIGAGQVLYLGLQETYRWRSQLGEKFYAQIWGQIFQALSMTSRNQEKAVVRLKSDRSSALLGDTVRIRASVRRPYSKFLVEPHFTASARLADGSAPASEISLQPLPGESGEYFGEFLAGRAGEYRISTSLDPSSALRIIVSEAEPEIAHTSLDERLLREMTSAADGQFLREENLHNLPDMIADGTSETISHRRIPLAFTPWLLALLILMISLEWAIRRQLGMR